ncbi:MAG: flagellar basal body P-ring formation chaperone FlgA [Azospirillaceae bacterium]
MKQLAVMLTTAVLFVVAVAAQAAEGAETVRLRAAAVATGEGLVLGDLFDGLGPERAARPVARAPAEGRTVRLEAGWLVRVARAHGVDWVPAGRDAAIDVRRATEAEREALADKLADALDARMAELERTAAGPAETEEAERPGRVDVAVLTRRLRPGDTIGAGDVDWVEMHAGPATAGMITEADAIIGLAPRRPLAAGRPVRIADLRTPVMVERGALVTLVLRGPALTITARGRVLDEASRGETVRVVNIDSNRTIEAVVTGPETAEVRSGSALVALN